MLTRLALLLIAMFALSSCEAPSESVDTAGAGSDSRLTELFNEYWEARLRERPTEATYLGDYRYDDRLTDYSDAARREAIALRRSLLRRLDGLAPSEFSANDALNARLFRHTLVEDIDLAQLPDRFLPVRQQNGPHITLPMLRLSQPMKTHEQCRKYARRLLAFPAQVDQVIDRMNAGVQKGIVAPRIVIEKTIPQIEAQMKDNPDESDLFSAYTAHHPDPKSPLRRSLDAEMRQAVSRAIDGYRKLRDYLRNDYLPVCRETVGVCHLPGGLEWYARAARHHTTTEKTPEEIHQTGLDELTRIHAAMRDIMRQVGFEGSIPEFFEHLRGRPDQHFSSASEMMRDFAAALRRSDANLPKLFGRLPKTPYDLKEIEAFRAPAAPAAYYYPAPDDGSRPAYFYVNTYQPEKRPRFTMEALAYHEAMPGHHLQIALVQENRTLPMFRRHGHVTVFVEGWGLYSESLGHDLGGYRDPYQVFGWLTFDAWRASRLVVDTGMHALGWTRQRAIDFMKQNTALSDLDIENEIDRYIAWPGQALAYKIGQLEISRMRAEAEAALGERFDIRRFHDYLLIEGPLPLDILQDRMANWVKMHGLD
jgi:uncharacterized protein (DUF885 family)